MLRELGLNFNPKSGLVEGTRSCSPLFRPLMFLIALFMF